MKTGILSIIENGSALRTTSIKGFIPHFHHLPEVGKSFVFMAEPLDPSASLRVVTTSTVKKVERIKSLYVDEYKIYTQNSIYRLQVDTA